MKSKSNSRILFSLAVTFALVTAIVAQDVPGPLTKFSPDQLKEDFQIARHALEEGHGGIYRYTPQAEMARVFDAAAKSLDRPMDALEIVQLLEVRSHADKHS